MLFYYSVVLPLQERSLKFSFYADNGVRSAVGNLSVVCIPNNIYLRYEHIICDSWSVSLDKGLAFQKLVKVGKLPMVFLK